MSYGIMVHNLEFDRANGYLDTLDVIMEEEQDFVDAQQLYLEYITGIDSFKLSALDSFRLAKAGEKFNPYAGYARSILRCFSSQFYDPDSKEPISPISGREFLDVILAAARVYGRIIGTEFGEGFTVQRAPGIKDFLMLD